MPRSRSVVTFHVSELEHMPSTIQYAPRGAARPHERILVREWPGPIASAASLRRIVSHSGVVRLGRSRFAVSA